jgi:DNA-binding transcriptional LysR family regulator
MGQQKKSTKKSTMDFEISSEDAEFLLAFEGSEGLSDLARIWGRDISVVSRRLKRLAGMDLLQKSDGHWSITDRGRRLNAWTKRALREQSLALSMEGEIRIGAPSEFVARFLSGGLSPLEKKGYRFSIRSSEVGVEKLLEERRIDIGFDCGAPYSPSIAFKRCARETFGIYLSSGSARQAIEAGKASLGSLDYFHYERFDFSHIRRAVTGVDAPKMTFNDVSSLKSFLMGRKGAWSVLPDYCVSREVDKGRLYRLSGEGPLSSMHFGVWWNRASPPSAELIEWATDWLSAQEKSLKRV